MKSSGGPLDNQTWQTEWKTTPLAKVQLCEYQWPTRIFHFLLLRMIVKLELTFLDLGGTRKVLWASFGSVLFYFRLVKGHIVWFHYEACRCRLFFNTFLIWQRLMNAPPVPVKGTRLVLMVLTRIPVTPFTSHLSRPLDEQVGLSYVSLLSSRGFEQQHLECY